MCIHWHTYIHIIYIWLYIYTIYNCIHTYSVVIPFLAISWEISVARCNDGQRSPHFSVGISWENDGFYHEKWWISPSKPGSVMSIPSKLGTSIGWLMLKIDLNLWFSQVSNFDPHMEFQLVGVCVCPSCSILHEKGYVYIYIYTIQKMKPLRPQWLHISTVEYHEAVRFGQVDNRCQGDGVDTIP